MGKLFLNNLLIAKNDYGETQSNTIEIEVTIPPGGGPSGGIPGFDIITVLSATLFMIGLIFIIIKRRRTEF